MQFLPRFERLAPGVEQCFDRFEILLLQLYVGGDGHRTEAVVTVSQLRGIAEFHQRVGAPFCHLAQLGFIGERGSDDLAFNLSLQDEEGCFRLSLPGLGDFDTALAPVPQRQWQRYGKAGLLLAIPGALLREVRPHRKGRIALLSSQRDFEALLPDFRLTHPQIKVVRARGREQSIQVRSVGEGQRRRLQPQHVRPRHAAQLIQFEPRALDCQRGFGRFSFQGQLGRLDDARLQQRRQPGGIALDQHFAQLLEATGHFLRHRLLLLRRQGRVSQRAGPGRQRHLELRQPKFGELNLMIGNRLAQRDAPRPLDGLLDAD